MGAEGRHGRFSTVQQEQGKEKKDRERKKKTQQNPAPHSVTTDPKEETHFQAEQDQNRARSESELTPSCPPTPPPPTPEPPCHKISLRLPAGAALLHHLGSVVARQLAEAIVAVDDGPVHYLSVSQNKVGVCTGGGGGHMGWEVGFQGEGGQKKGSEKKAAYNWRESASLLQNKTRL